MKAAYFDTAYLLKLNFLEPGSDLVLATAEQFDTIACSLHGKAEFFSAAHRKVREGAATREDFAALSEQIDHDTRLGGLKWIPLGDPIIDMVEAVFRSADNDLYLRAADALHLACAAQSGFGEIFSNDRHLLAAAPHFGLAARDVLDSP